MSYTKTDRKGNPMTIRRVYANRTMHKRGDRCDIEGISQFSIEVTKPGRYLCVVKGTRNPKGEGHIGYAEVVLLPSLPAGQNPFGGGGRY